jgi:hypothetical protein
VFLLAIMVCAASCLWLDAAAVAETECANAANPVACENALPGDPQSDWQVQGVGDPTIQGYATSMSANVGETVNFKIKTPASSYHIDILRLGYYGGLGARKIASNIQPSAKLPQTQPECLQRPTTGLIDCGNWGVSASWTVPKNAVSGVYVAHLVRNDTGGSSQIPFVVRNDSSHSEILLQTSDETWEAYNAYGGNSLYGCTVACPPSKAKAYKGAYSVSYNRPFDGSFTEDRGASYLYYAEYQMIYWLEKNGYNVSYTSQSEVDRNGALLKNHKLFVSSGHDEYWSAAGRANVEAARESGVNLAFFSGNEVFWKTRFEASTEGSNTPYRTLTTYKETHWEGPSDPADPPVWTGAWNDPRGGPTDDGGKPQNALTGQQFEVNSGTSDITVPSAEGKLRLWRHTSVETLGSGQALTLAPGQGTLGYEWDEDVDNGFRPAGEFDLSTTVVSGVQAFVDYGTNITGSATATHHLTLYRAPSGAIVFGAGTVQFSWGLANVNAWNYATTEPHKKEPDANMQQFTVNLFAEMGVQPSTLTSGLLKAEKSADTTAPTSKITSPTPASNLQDASSTTVTGTATDSGGGVVAGVEVSTDNGNTWHPATLTTAIAQTVSWSYAWAVHGNPSTTIKSRAVDDSGNLEKPAAGTAVNVACPCAIWGKSFTPAIVDSGDPKSITLGVSFSSEVTGTITGIRYYKAATNTGTHVGSLWTSSGQLLASATFTGESSSGWQQVSFSSPVTISANTKYVASYFAPAGHYSETEWYFYTPTPVGGNVLNSAPLHATPGNAAPVGGEFSSLNGLYSYGASSKFPVDNENATNFWVEPVFMPNGSSSGPPGQPGNVTATAGVGSATVSWSAPNSGGPVTEYKITPYVSGVAKTATVLTGNPPATSTTISGLTNGTTYTFTVQAINSKGASPTAESNAVVPGPPGQPGSVTATPGVTSATISWNAPASGGPVTEYRVTPHVKGEAKTATVLTGNPPVTSATISGLTSGATYTFTVQAFNSQGPGPVSAESNAVVPSPPGVPSAPGTPTASAATRQALLSWSEPTSNGGSAITGYKITPYIGSTAQTATEVGPSVLSTTITGLTNGTAYTFKVQALNANGQGVVSSPSAAVTPEDTIFDFATPPTTDSGDSSSVELGVKFTSSAAGRITGIRFYKAAANTGVHVGSLWSSTGTLLASATFTAETATGWQQVNFESPVAIAANTTYVAGYFAPKGHYSESLSGFATAGVANSPLEALANSTSANGVYAYSGSSTFPSSSYKSTDYYVDVDFEAAPATVPGQVSGVSAAAGAAAATVTWNAPTSGGAVTEYKITPYIGTVAQTATTITGAPPATNATIAGLKAGTAYKFTVQALNSYGAGTASSASNEVTPTPAGPASAPSIQAVAVATGQAQLSWSEPSSTGGSPISGYKITPYVSGVAKTATEVTGTATSAIVTGLTNGTTYTFTVAAVNGSGPGAASEQSPGVIPRHTILDFATPPVPDSGDPHSVELGVKFSSEVAGHITGVRFYKAPTNTGTHIASLWTASGELLASATFGAETASGWQQVNFETPVAIAANTTYVAAYLAPAGHYSETTSGFSSALTNAPLMALANSVSADGVYGYTATSAFPASTWQATNYWVDVDFESP